MRWPMPDALKALCDFIWSALGVQGIGKVAYKKWMAQKNHPFFAF